MYVPVENMNNEARVWVYGANRTLTNEEIQSLKFHLTQFTQNWLSHGNEVKASFDILYNQFIVLIADENQSSTSGCSIDSSVAFIRNLEKEFNIILLDRQQIFFLIDTKIIQIPYIEVQKQLNVLKNKDSKIFFNTLVENLKELKNYFLIEPEKSWIKNHL